MAIAETYTLLSLDRYARLMGLDPVRFSGGAPVNLASGATLFPLLNDVKNIWPQSSWLSTDQIGRDELARIIAEAERDIAEFLGYWPAPVWISQEMHPYPKGYQPGRVGFGLGTDGKFRALKTKFAKFIQGGRRAVTLVEAGAAVVYSDPDGDGFNELATVTVLNVTQTDECKLKAYFASHGGAQAWEIREPLSKSLAAGTLVLTFRPWQLLDPDVQRGFPADEPMLTGTGLNMTDTDNLVDTIDVYYEYTDTTQAQALFYFEGYPSNLGAFPAALSGCSCCDGDGCAACTQNTQNGCLTWRDVDRGLVVPIPASYDEDSGEWVSADWTCSREPDSVKLYYQAGAVSNEFRSGSSCREMESQLERAIAYLATARVGIEYPSNNNVKALVRDLDVDLTRQVQDGDSYRTSFEVLDCPFGTKKGEVQAWRLLQLRSDIVPNYVGMLR